MLNTLKGALKSKTVWFGAVVAGLLPYTQDLVGFASGISPEAGAIVGAVMVVLRVVTTTKLSDK